MKIQTVSIAAIRDHVQEGDFDVVVVKSVCRQLLAETKLTDLCRLISSQIEVDEDGQPAQHVFITISRGAISIMSSDGLLQLEAGSVIISTHSMVWHPNDAAGIIIESGRHD